MEAGDEEIREELKGWNIDELLFGLSWELTLSGEKSFDESLVSLYLDAIEEKLPPPSRTCASPTRTSERKHLKNQA